MKVFTTISELDNGINELQERAKSDKYYYRLYLVGEQTIREAISKYNVIVKSMQGLSGLFADADSNVQGLSLSGSEELEFVDVASIEGLTNSSYIAINGMFKVVKYKDYLLKPLKYSGDKTYHFTFLQDPIKITVRTPKPNKVSVLTDKKADAWVSALLEDIRQSELAKQAADARKKAFMQKISKLTNLPEETFAKNGRINAGIVNIKWEFDEQGKAYTSVDFRLTTDEVLQKLSENGLLENK